MIKFGTGGWRDIIGEGFTFDNVRIFSQGVAQKIRDENKVEQGVVLGYDNRFMSEDYARAAAEVFAANNIPVYLLETSSPTPLVTYATIKKQTAAGLMVTASHNSYIYNGIKFVDEGGEPATEAITTELESYMNRLTIESVMRMDYEKAVKKELIQIFNFQQEFMTFVKSQLDMDVLRSGNLNVLYDPMYGTGGNPFLDLLVDSQCRFELIHFEVDPLFGGRVPAPSKQTLWQLIAMMKEKSYDIGIATDGDADRVAIIDNHGDYVHPNEIIAILYYYFLEYKKMSGAVVRNVSTTHLIDKIAQAYGEECIETPVGFKYIAEGMITKNALIGGESSGGITIRDHLLEKDGILAAGLILEMLVTTGKSLTDIRHELIERFGNYAFVEDFIVYPDDQKEAILTYLTKEFKPTVINGVKVNQIDRLDGIKYLLENGDWISIRFSGTEPLLRFMAESTVESDGNNLINYMKKQIKPLITV